MYYFRMGRNAGPDSFVQYRNRSEKGLGLIREDTVLNFLYGKNIFYSYFYRNILSKLK